jgi:2-polyprenyl-3-methyl-5-hydroxy-6-metoxy-1,4-benzoquinol methylase
MNLYPFPRLDDKSVLDVGCSDGFFSMYFKKNLNAKSVLGLDSNRYDGNSAIEHMLSEDSSYVEKYQASNDYSKFKSIYESFDLGDANKFKFIAKLYELDLKFQNGSIYDMSNLPKFDFVFCGSLIEHLRDPITAVEQLYDRTNDLCIIDLSSPLNRIFNWKRFPIIRYMNSGGCFYNFSETAFKQLVLKCGFKSVEIGYRYKLFDKKTKRMTPHSVFICNV